MSGPRHPLDLLADDLADRIATKVVAILAERQTAPCGPEPALYTVPEAADYLGVSEAQVRRLVAAQALPAVRFDRYIRLRRADLDAFLEAQAG